jgi:hypothetical protein
MSSSKTVGSLLKPTVLDIRFEKCSPTTPGGEGVVDDQSYHLYPTILPQPLCLLCIGREELSYERRMRHVLRKDVLKKHIMVHFKDLGISESLNAVTLLVLRSWMGWDIS